MMYVQQWVVCVAVGAVICTLLPSTVGAEHTSHSAQLKMRERRAIGNKLGAFSLFVQLITQTTNETVSAYRQIRQLLADSVGPAPAPTNQTSNPTSATAADAGTNSDVASTTAAPYRATSEELRTILRRNIQGLRNLFKMELRLALADSGKNIVSAGKELLRPVSTTAKPS